jgi:hypothetical protein
MQKILKLLALSFLASTLLAADATDAVFPNPAERKLSLIKVEMAEKTKSRKLSQSHRAFYRKVRKMASKFGLNKDIDSQEADAFFSDLENQIYENMKKSLYKQRKFVQSYSAVVDEYKRLSEKYPQN